MIYKDLQKLKTILTTNSHLLERQPHQKSHRSSSLLTDRIPRLTWVSERAMCNPINEGAILFILFVISMIGSMRSVFCVSNRGPPGIYTCAYRGAGSHVTRVSGYPLTCGTSTLNRTSQSWGGTISNKHATG